MFQYSADGVQGFLGHAGVLVTGKERFAVFPDAGVGVHPCTIVVIKRFGHKGYGMAVFIRHIFKHVLKPHELIAHLE